MADAVEVHIDAYGSMLSRRPTSTAEASTVAVVLEALRTQPEDVKAQRRGLDALQNLALDNDNERFIAEAGGIAVVLEALEKYPQDVEVQRYGLGTFMILAADDNNSKSIAGAGGIAVVLEALRNHPQSVEVQREGLGVLNNLAKNGDNQRILAGAGGIAVVLWALRNHPRDVLLQREGLGALGSFTLDAANRKSITGAGGISVVVEALRNEDVLVQRYGLGALINLANFANNKKSIEAECGGFLFALQLLLKALKTYRDTVKREGLGTSMNVVTDASFWCWLLAPLLHYIRSTGGAARTEWSDNAAVVLDAMWAMQDGLVPRMTVAADVNNRSSIVEADCIKVLLEAMRTCPKDAEAQRKGLHALVDITASWKDEANSTPEFHEFHAGVPRRSFTSSIAGARSIAGAGGIAVVLEALRTHSEAEAQRPGLFLLWTLALDGQSRQSIKRLGGIAVVFRALEHNRKNVELQQLGVNTLNVLAYSAQEIATSRNKAEIGNKFIDYLQTCEESLQGSWWHIFSQFDPELALPVNQDIPDWTDVQPSVVWECSKGMLLHRDWRNYTIKIDDGSEPRTWSLPSDEFRDPPSVSPRPHYTRHPSSLIQVRKRRIRRTVGYAPLNLLSSETIFSKLRPVGHIISVGGQGLVVKGSEMSGGAELAMKIYRGCKKDCSSTYIENAIYLAAVHQHGTYLAAKEPCRTAISQKERIWIDEVEAEARAMLELQQSPHVLGAYAAGWYKSIDTLQSQLSGAPRRYGVGAYAIAMELAKMDLAQVIYSTESSEAQVALLVAGVVFGLRDMHAEGVLHCDLKPGNVLVVPVEGRDLCVAKIADLGSVCCDGTDGDRSFACSSWKLPSCATRRPGTDRYWAPEKTNTATNTFATDVFSAGLVVYEMLSANNNMGRKSRSPATALTFDELVNEVSELRYDAESDRVRQELNLSIAIPYAAIEEPLRELLQCTLTPDPKDRCDINKAARFADRMLAAVKLDSYRIFKDQLWKKNKRFCASQHDTAYSAENKGKAPGLQVSLPHSAVPDVGTARAPEIRGMDSLKISDTNRSQDHVDAFDAVLVPLIRKGRTKGTVENLESGVRSSKHAFLHGKASSARAFRAALPFSLKAWDKYRPDLVNRSVIEIYAVRFDGDLHLVVALAQQPDLMEAARRAARLKKLWVNFRIESSPLDLLERTGGRE